jgi:hypothetical protein
MTDAPDGPGSAITSHPFEPRLEETGARGGGINPNTEQPNGWVYTRLPPNPFLCQHCGLAEAAHSASTMP